MRAGGGVRQVRAHPGGAGSQRISWACDKACLTTSCPHSQRQPPPCTGTHPPLHPPYSMSMSAQEPGPWKRASPVLYSSSLTTLSQVGWMSCVERAAQGGSGKTGSTGNEKQRTGRGSGEQVQQAAAAGVQTAAAGWEAVGARVRQHGRARGSPCRQAGPLPPCRTSVVRQLLPTSRAHSHGSSTPQSHRE